MPGKMALITGSSHLHLVVCSGEKVKHASGVWGAYKGAPLLGLGFAGEGKHRCSAVQCSAIQCIEVMCREEMCV